MTVNILVSDIMGESWLRSLNTIWPALVFFSLNKVVLGWLNGCSIMKEYAFFQAARNLLIVASLCALAYVGVQGDRLPIVFFAGEGVLFLAEVAYLVQHLHLRAVLKMEDFKNLFAFGIRILPANAVLELNTKLDVICLAFLLRDEYAVGVYSFAAMFCEGFYQLFVVVRRILNPMITAAWYGGYLSKYLEENMIRYMRFTRPAGIVALGLVCAVFWGLVRLMGNDNYMIGLPIMAGVCLFMIFNAQSIIYGNILSQTGHPTQESMVNIITTVCNGLMNMALIPVIGMYGAALATGLSYCVFGMVQRHYAKNSLEISN